MNKLSSMNDLINKISDKEFEYGVNDCYTFTASLLKEWHGKDYSRIHAAYESEEEASVYVSKLGGMERLITGTLGYPVAETTTCQDGDVVIAEVAPGEIGVGFVYEGYGLFRGKKTVLKKKLEYCIRGWRIK